MAQPITCDSNDGNPAAMLVTNLSDGDTSGWCVECLPTFCRQILAMFDTEEPPADVPTSDDGPGDPAGEGGEAGTVEPIAPPKSRRAAATAEPDAEPVAETAAASDAG